MPLYLVHGFKWPRYDILVHVLSNGLEAATPDWTMSNRTSDELLAYFCITWPNIMEELPDLRFFEQYEPSENTEVDSMDNFAFVADRVQECGLSVKFATLASIAAHSHTNGAGALGELRDHLAKEADIGWWVVYNADEKREYIAGGNAAGNNDEEQAVEGNGGIEAQHADAERQKIKRSDPDKATQTSGGLLEDEEPPIKERKPSKPAKQYNEAENKVLPPHPHPPFLLHPFTNVSSGAAFPKHDQTVPKILPRQETLRPLAKSEPDPHHPSSYTGRIQLRGTRCIIAH